MKELDKRTRVLVDIAAYLLTHEQVEVWNWKLQRFETVWARNRQFRHQALSDKKSK